MFRIYFFLETYFPEKRTVISFHPQKLDSTMFPKDKEIWESYFLMESNFLGFNKVEVDILGLPLKKLKVEKDAELGRGFLFLFFFW